MISYGVIIGLLDDDEEVLLRFEEVLWEVYYEVKVINLLIIFQVSFFVIFLILGILQGEIICKFGLLWFEDLVFFVGFWIVSVDMKYLSYEEVFDWQFCLVWVGDLKNL